MPTQSHNLVNLPSKPVFVPMSCYVSTLKLALELSLELRLYSNAEIHRTQVEEIDAALVEVGEGRPALQAIAGRVELVEIPRPYYVFPHFWRRRWQQKGVRVSRREYDEVRVGQAVLTRGVLAVATMKTHEYPGKYSVRLDFKERK